MGKIRKILVIGFFPVTIFSWIIIRIIRAIAKRLDRKRLKTITMSQVDGLDGHEFEDLVYAILTSLGIRTRYTSRVKDYGGDLIISNRGHQVVIQCKLYYRHAVGNSAVQEVLGAKSYYGADNAVVITNWHYSSSAKVLAEKSGVRLIGRETLLSIIDGSMPIVEIMGLLFDTSAQNKVQ